MTTKKSANFRGGTGCSAGWEQRSPCPGFEAMDFGLGPKARATGQGAQLPLRMVLHVSSASEPRRPPWKGNEPAPGKHVKAVPHLAALGSRSRKQLLILDGLNGRPHPFVRAQSLRPLPLWLSQRPLPARPTSWGAETDVERWTQVLAPEAEPWGTASNR